MPVQSTRPWIRAATLLVVLLPAVWARAQQDTPPRPDPPPRVDYDSQPPYTAYELDWARRFPAPYRRPFRQEYYPYGRPYYTGRQGIGAGRRDYRRGGYGFDYDYGYGYPSPIYFDDGYESGFKDGRRFQRWQHRAELGLKSYLQAMEQGVARFRAGDYGGASRQFVLAAELNQGDAASRLHVVHAFTALGHYAEAVPALRRALQLQPRLIYLPLDIRSEYGQPNDFATHLNALGSAAQKAPDDPNLQLLLGYYQMFSGNTSQAAQSLKKAAQLAPNDTATSKLLDAARLSAPAGP